MLTKPQYLYQAKLIIDCLPEEEYNSIPKETLKYIEENMQVDTNIKIGQIEKDKVIDYFFSDIV